MQFWSFSHGNSTVASGMMPGSSHSKIGNRLNLGKITQIGQLAMAGRDVSCCARQTNVKRTMILKRETLGHVVQPLGKLEWRLEWSTLHNRWTKLLLANPKKCPFWAVFGRFFMILSPRHWFKHGDPLMWHAWTCFEHQIVRIKKNSFSRALHGCGRLR